jgi:dipeptidyl-peptidase-4
MLTTRFRLAATRRIGFALFAALAVLAATLIAQDRLKSMPCYDQYQKMSKEISGAFKSGAISVTWKDAGAAFEYQKDNLIYRYDIATKTATEVGPAPERPAGPGQRGEGRPPAAQSGTPERGRQVATAPSPDSQFKAFYRDRNLWLSETSGANERALTTDGNDKDRIKYGTASWVYGEELSQTTAMWWSPDSTKLAFYRFDEKQVDDYYLQMDQTKLYSRIDVEAYPKAGRPNPMVDLFVYDRAAGKAVKVDVRDGKPFDNTVVGHYVYNVAWSPDGKELLFNRTNRRQNILELVAANPATGACRVIIHEEWPTGWVENRPAMVFLKDGRRFIWESERNGWRNFYLYDLSGKLLLPLTSHTSFEAVALVKIDEAAGLVFYSARDGDNSLKTQLHRVGLDGKGNVRLTDPAFNHSIGSCMPRPAGARGGPGGAGGGSCGVSPDNKHVLDVYQTHDKPPATRLIDAAGKVVAELAASDMTKYEQLGFKKAEMFTYLAADGRTTLHGVINFPSNFDPAKKYPALVQVYGGPASASNTARETFVPPVALTEYGFLVLNLDSRAAPGMGKRTLDAIYLKLGQVEMDDMAEGVKSLWSRPYFDRQRVGIYGTSYGGYSSLMCVLRHPEVFRAGAASSPPTAWYHYDTIYTERYMWIPDENKEGYETGSAMTYADKLNGRLLIYYGTADNNVHPTNSMQLIAALRKAGKSFEVQVGPDAGHSGVAPDRMMEFFIENLVINTPPPVSLQAPPTAPSRQANAELATFPSSWTYRPGAKAPAFPHGMVASNCALATKAGVEVLEAGGNAVDAAVAVGFALAVAYPEAGNIGGGGYAVARMGSTDLALDFRETAPAAASRNMYIGPDGKPGADSLVGHRASGVPGSVAGLLALLDQHGSLPRARVMAPAIRLAREGFVVDPNFHASVAQNADLIAKFPGAGLFLPGGHAPATGTRFVQADLARTLQTIADKGADGYYRGPVAESVAAEMRRGHGTITAADLAGYRPAWRTPLVGNYRGRKLIAMPPSSSGGITVLETLNILEPWQNPAPWNSATALHRLASAFQRAFVDRNNTLGDPAFVKMPLATLLSKAYAQKLQAGIPEAKATPTFSLKPVASEGTDTTNYAVVDRDGNAVVVTTTLNSLYGSGVWVPGAGFFLNDQMDDFAAQPGTPNQFGLVQGEANAIAPGKRMLSAMAPTIVLDPNGQVLMLVGGRGGPRIITAVVQAIVNVIDYRMTLADAVGAPRIHEQALPDQLEYEKDGVPDDVVAQLNAMGYKTQPGATGSLTAIKRTANGWEGLFDPRKHGLAAGY